MVFDDFVFLMPTKILYGPGSHREIAAEISDLGCSRAVVVTDPNLAKTTDIADRVIKALGSTCVGVYDQVEPDATVRSVDRGAAFVTDKEADCLVSVGGGSSIDSAKAIAVVATNGGSISDHYAVNALSEPQLPHVAVPTTAGTGSEVTNVALVKDREKAAKFFLLDNQIFPRLAILDPELTIGLPGHLTAATAMDAITHSVEAVTSLVRNPVSESMAVQAISMIASALPVAIDTPADIAARGALLSAATMAGAAFCNAMVGLAHAAAHALGGVCSVHHGLANSIVLPHVVRYNAETNAEDYLPVARPLGIDSANPREAAEEIATTLHRMASSAGIATRLSEAGVSEENLPEVAEKAISDGAIINNCRPVAGIDEVLGLLRRAL